MTLATRRRTLNGGNKAVALLVSKEQDTLSKEGTTIMQRMNFLTSWGVLATVALTALAPISAFADGASTQKNKNQWRNLGVLGAAVAGYGLLKHNSTATILGAAGAAYSANRYEQDRRSQSQANANRHRNWYYRNNNGYNNNNGYYGNNSYSNNNGNNGYTNNNGSYDNNNNNGYNSSDDNQQKHHGKGWYKHHGDDHEGDDNH